VTSSGVAAVKKALPEVRVSHSTLEQETWANRW
jgi:hypothetical protein